MSNEDPDDRELTVLGRTVRHCVDHVEVQATAERTRS